MVQEAVLLRIVVLPVIIEFSESDTWSPRNSELWERRSRRRTCRVQAGLMEVEREDTEVDEAV